MSEPATVAVTLARTAVLMEQRDDVAGKFRAACDELTLFKVENNGDSALLRSILKRKLSDEESLRSLNRDLRAIEFEGEAARWRAFMTVTQQRVSPELFAELLAAADERVEHQRTSGHIHRQSGRPRIPVGATTPHQET
jgi:hypothetical protein